MKTRFAVLGLLLAGLLNAQNVPDVTKVIRVHGNPEAVRNIACYNQKNVSCAASNSIDAVVVKGPSNEVINIEQTIRELDSLSPTSAGAGVSKSVELTIYVVGGSEKGFVGAQDARGQALAPVLTQLRAAFPYSHYQLLATMIMRSCLNKQSTSSGVMGIQSDPALSMPSFYVISFDSAKVSDRNSVNLTKFRFDLNTPIVEKKIMTGSDKNQLAGMGSSYRMADITIETDVDLREGQKVVVGKTNISDSDSCIFLVLSAKLVP